MNFELSFKSKELKKNILKSVTLKITYFFSFRIEKYNVLQKKP